MRSQSAGVGSLRQIADGNQRYNGRGRRTFGSSDRQRCSRAEVFGGDGRVPNDSTRVFITFVKAAGGVHIVAVASGEVIGWCDIIPHPFEGMQHVGRLGMGVQKDHRSRGIGRSFWWQVKKGFEGRFDRIELEVFATNRSAVNLYEKFGFKCDKDWSELRNRRVAQDSTVGEIEIAGDLNAMNEILETREILGTLQLPEGECELIASATAEYSEGSGNLLVRLEAAVHRRDGEAKSRPLAVQWLPNNQTISEFVPIEEAGEVARDIFRRWVRKVRESARNLHQPSFT